MPRRRLQRVCQLDVLQRLRRGLLPTDAWLPRVPQLSSRNVYKLHGLHVACQLYGCELRGPWDAVRERHQRALSSGKLLFILDASRASVSGFYVGVDDGPHLCGLLGQLPSWLLRQLDESNEPSRCVSRV